MTIFFKPTFTRLKSLIPRPKPMPMIGPMSGEMSMAPIITATELVLRPKEATNIAKMRISSWEPRNETPDRMSCSAML